MSTAHAIPVLMYHHVSPNPGLVTVSPATFRAHMETIATNGYHAISADDFLLFLQGHHDLPAKSVLITFDDGYLDNYVHAWPVLQELGLKATIFAVTGWVGDGPARHGDLPCPDHKTCMAKIREGQGDEVMLRWAEIEAMETSGAVEVHSHTHTHTRWDKQLADPAARRAALVRDLAHSRDALKERLGRKERHLCWPQGYFDDDYVTVAQELGFEALYTTRRHVNTRRTSPLGIGRIVTKERADRWLTRRLAIYSSPWLGRLYTTLRGEA
ncbi:MAG: polysaccharide deacetylase family protein [Sulfuricellaceae bacterium]|jgi:peptidoglycan/xylan/chitin deacetylase (PgdA/CDA1 family)